MIAYRIIESNGIDITSIKHYYVNTRSEALKCIKKSKYSTVSVVKFEGEYVGRRFIGKPIDIIYKKYNGVIQK